MTLPNFSLNSSTRSRCDNEATFSISRLARRALNLMDRRSADVRSSSEGCSVVGGSSCWEDASASADEDDAASFEDSLCLDLDDFFLDFLSPLKLSLPRPDMVAFLFCSKVFRQGDKRMERYDGGALLLLSSRLCLSSLLIFVVGVTDLITTFQLKFRGPGRS